MIPTAGQFRKLGELFEKEAKKSPGLSHTIIPIAKISMDFELAEDGTFLEIPNFDEIDEYENQVFERVKKIIKL